MRPLFQALVTQIGTAELIAINVFNEQGVHADQIIRGVVDELTLIDVILETMRLHGFETVDAETDSDTLFKIFMAAPGVNIKLVSSNNLSGLYRHLAPGSPIYPILESVCGVHADEELTEGEGEPETPVLPWYIRLIKYIKGVFINA